MDSVSVDGLSSELLNALAISLTNIVSQKYHTRTLPERGIQELTVCICE